MKKNYFILGFVGLFLSCTMYLISCSENDEIELVSNESEANSHFPRLRNTNLEGHDYLSNECGIWCIVQMIDKQHTDVNYNKVRSYAIDAGWDPEDKTKGLTNTQIIEVCSKLDINISQSEGDAQSARTKLQNIGQSGQKSKVILLINDRITGAHYVTLKEYQSSNSISVFDSNSPNNIKYITLNDVQAIIY